MRSFAGRFAPAIAALLLGITALTSGRASAQESRTWTDSTGAHKMQAEFVSQNGDKVTLRNPNGQTFEIGLSQLSAADRKYVEDRNSDAGGENLPGQMAGQGRILGMPDASGNVARGPELKIAPPVGGWNYTPSGQEKLPFRAKEFDLPNMEFAESLEHFRITPSGLFGVLTSQSTRGGTRVVILDLAKSRMSAFATAPGEYVARALSDDGQRILVQKAEFIGNNYELQVFTIKGKQLEPDCRLYPFMDERENERKVIWAEFVGRNRLALLGERAGFSMWDLDRGEEVCRIPLEDSFSRDVAAARSFDGNTIALANKNQLALLNVHTLEFAGVASTSMDDPETLAFSPSGKRLVAAGSGKVLVWDAATGEGICEIPELGGFLENVSFAQENYVLVDNKHLLDLESQMKLWTYEGRHFTDSAGGVTFFAIERRRRGDAYAAIVPVILPDKDAQKVLDDARNKPELFVIRPGGTLALDVSGIPDAYREQVRQQLAERLKKIQVTVADDAPARVVARIDGPVRTPALYKRQGESQAQQYQINLSTSSLVVVSGDQVVWKQQATNRVSSVYVKDGESIQAELDARMKEPNLRLFQGAAIPPLVQRVDGRNQQGFVTLGRTHVQ